MDTNYNKRFYIFQDKNNYPFYSVCDRKEENKLPNGHYKVVSAWLKREEAVCMKDTLNYIEIITQNERDNNDQS